MTLTLRRELWLEPMRTGGGGTIIEVLLGLTVTVAAVLAALGWRGPEPRASSDEDEAPSETE
jgi:hypothetical protein